ncbi:MAG: helix-turn-helix transcriptional regulator [Magnetococcales bacterium]|nr:helix-turn-helix transcriptional regulator [Magnetococcales bacterium]
MDGQDVKPGFQDRLRLVIGDQAPFRWAREVGIGKSTFDGLWNKGTRPQLKTLLKIAWETDISLSWLLTGKGGHKLPSTSEEYQPITLCSQTEPLNTLYPLHREGYILVPRYSIQECPKAHNFFCQAQQVDHLAFKAGWIIQDLGLDPEKLALIPVQGDSMTPTLNQGDLLLLDRRERLVRSDGIYVVCQKRHLMPKRLQRGFDGSVMIKSDNPIYETQTVQEREAARLTIVGRVVWAGHRM